MPNLSRRDFLKIAGFGIGGTILVSENAHAASPITDPSKHIGMLYDSTMCVGCHACTMACRQWNKTTPELDAGGLHDAPRGLSADTWTLIQLYQEEGNYAFVKHQCMHCIEPGCVSGCPVEALQKTAAGPVTYDPSRCIGCRYCMYTCPFHVPRFEWDETIPLITKCTLCNDRIQNGKGPACAEICPTGALIWGQRGDLLTEAEKRLKENADRYVDYIYGKDDAGGTSVLYLSAVPFDKLGFKDLGYEPVPRISEDTAKFVLPSILIGGPLLLAAVRNIGKREGWEETWPL